MNLVEKFWQAVHHMVGRLPGRSVRGLSIFCKRDDGWGRIMPHIMWGVVRTAFCRRYDVSWF